MKKTVIISILLFSLLLSGCFYSQEDLENAYKNGYETGYSDGIDEWENFFVEEGRYEGFHIGSEETLDKVKEELENAKSFAVEGTNHDFYSAWNDILCYQDDPQYLTQAEYDQLVNILVRYASYMDEVYFD